MKQRFLLLLVACFLTVQQCLQAGTPSTPTRDSGAAAGAGRSPARPLGTPPRRRGCVFTTPPTGIARTPPTVFHHSTPMTPEKTRRFNSITRKDHARKRVSFSDEIASALNASPSSEPMNKERNELQGILLVEQRVHYNYPKKLRNHMQKVRKIARMAFGGEGSSIKSKQSNFFQHTVPLTTIIAAIQQGKTFTFEKNGKTHLEIIVKATLFSNDHQIQGWFSTYNEIRLTFGYTKECMDSTNPFLLYHARGEEKNTRNPLLRRIEGVTAYLDDTVFDDRPVLRFRIPPTP